MAWNRFKTFSLILAALLLVLSLVSYLFFFRNKTTQVVSRVVVNKQVIKVEIARSPQSQYQGLSGREALCPACGMLFIFPNKQELEFVMRDMKFPLDIIFIADGRVINIFENLQPEASQPTNFYKSTGAADQVLELNSGDARRYGINIGTEIKLIN